jgi:hypothetical protein
VDVEVEPLPPTVRPGFATALDIHTRTAPDESLDGATCTATLRWPGGAHRWRFRGDVGAGGHVRIGTVQFEVPVGTPAGELVLEVEVGSVSAHVTASIVTG